MLFLSPYKSTCPTSSRSEASSSSHAASQSPQAISCASSPNAPTSATPACTSSSSVSLPNPKPPQQFHLIIPPRPLPHLHPRRNLDHQQPRARHQARRRPTFRLQSSERLQSCVRSALPNKPGPTLCARQRHLSWPHHRRWVLVCQLLASAETQEQQEGEDDC